MRRIIHPYMTMTEHDQSTLPKDMDPKIKEFYIDTDGVNMIPLLESPPLSKNFMDSYNSSINKSRSTRNVESNIVSNGRTYSYLEDNGEHDNGKIAEVDEDEETDNNDIDNGEYTFTNRNYRKDGQEAILENSFGNEHSLLPGKETSGSVKLNTDPIFSADSDSDTLSSVKKLNRRSSIPFVRMFKSRRGTTDSAKRNENEHKTTIGQQRKGEALRTPHTKKSNRYDMNFDFDENLEEEEDDEDEGEDGGDSLFFQLDKNDRITSAGSLNANSEEKPEGTTIAGNVSRLKSHFPTILESSKNTSSKSNSFAGGKNEFMEASNSTTGTGTHKEYGSTEDHRTNKHDSIDDDISDLESYINGHDLDGLNLDTLTTNTEKGSFSKHNSDNEMGDIREGNRLTAQATGELTDSSYGKSLLESEFSGDDDLDEGTSTMGTTSLSMDSEMEINTIPSNSIPMALGSYGIYPGDDDSQLRNVFDKAVLNIKRTKNQRSREKRSSSVSLRDSAGRALTSKKYSYNPSVSSRQQSSMHKSHSKISTSSASVDPYKSSRHLDAKSRRIPSNLKYEHSVSGVTSSNHSSRRNSKDGFSVEKLTEIPSVKEGNSQLSELFNRKKQSDGITTDVLEYFSFVSGTKVPKYDALDLDVYIQASKKYKRNPLKMKVRKSAKIFEVIGFILYTYCSEFKPSELEKDSFAVSILVNPNNFSLNIVDEDGEPFEDNFGKLERKRLMESISDNEVVLCKVNDNDEKKNQLETPIPYDLNGQIIEPTHSNTLSANISDSDSIEGNLNQLSFYKPIIGTSTDDLLNKSNSSKIIGIKVFLYPNLNPKYNFTIINVLVTSSINDILIKYCKMKKIPPNDYCLKIPDKKYILDLNDTILRLDGNYNVEIVSKKDARALHFEKMKPDIKKPNLPTIQSNDLTPLTLETAGSYLKADNTGLNECVLEEPAKDTKLPKSSIKSRKLSAKHKLGLTKQSSYSSNSSFMGTANGSFFKTKNSSKSSIHSNPGLAQNPLDHLTDNSTGNNYQDLFTGAYHKYKVWRKQQMSFINKHERTLAIDGDYIYIAPPEWRMHWHENIKTKSLHISQVVLVKKSSRVPEQFKIFVRRSNDDIKRYYFEAVSPEECTEIVTRLQNLLNAYKMNHK